MRLSCLLLLAASLLAGCSSYDGVAGNFPPQAQLSLSPDGSRLVVSWYAARDELTARLIALDGNQVQSVSNLALPPDTWTTEFSYDGTSLLITTLQKGEGSKLVKLNLEDGGTRVIYSSKGDLRFPLEIRPEEYAFLESTSDERRLSQWRRLKDGDSTLLNTRHYGLATTPSITGDSIYIFEPSGTFRELAGRLPREVDAIASKQYFSINCSDSNPVLCYRDNLVLRDGLGYYAVAEIVSASAGCWLGGYWLDKREVRISRNGKTVAFHAALAERNGPRGLYVVNSRDCSTQQISIDVANK